MGDNQPGITLNNSVKWSYFSHHPYKTKTKQIFTTSRQMIALSDFHYKNTMSHQLLCPGLVGRETTQVSRGILPKRLVRRVWPAF